METKCIRFAQIKSYKCWGIVYIVLYAVQCSCRPHIISSLQKQCLNICDTFCKLNISTPSYNYSDMPNYSADIKKVKHFFKGDIAC